MPQAHRSRPCHPRAAWLALALALTGWALPASAAEPAQATKPVTRPAAKPAAKPAEKPAAKTVGTGPLLTRAELRECMAQQDRNRSDATTLEAEAAKVTEEKARLIAQGDELKQQLAALDRTSAEAVDKYNAQAAARDAAVDAFNTRSSDFNNRVEAAQKVRAAYTKACENRSYDERDENAIRAGK